MIEFTKEEISLCKQVAERYRKPLKDGCLVLGTYLSGKEFVGHYYEELTKDKLGSIRPTRLDEIMIGLCTTAKTTTPIIALWTISDCLEFLRERKIDCELFELSSERKEGFVRVTLWKTIRVSRHYWFNKNGKTPLEACLKTVLAVLEEGK